MKNKQPKKGKAHADLGNFSIAVTEFGEIAGNIDIDKINSFLNKNVADKKLNRKQIKP